MKKLLIILCAIQGALMATSLTNISINDRQVPLVYEEGKYIPIVSLQLIFTNAGHLSNSKDGLADMAAKLLNEGTAKDGSLAFATKLDAQAVELHAGVGRESFVIEISALKDDFAYVVARLKELLLDPNYTKEALDQIKYQKLGWLQQKKSDFAYIASTALRAEIFKGTALAKAYDGTEESVKSITLEDIQAFISTSLGYNNAIVLVGGDIGLEDASKYSKELLSLLPKVNVKSSLNIQASAKQSTVLADEETEQAYIYFAAPFDYSYKEADQYKVSIAEYLLGGGGFGSRMMEEIRVKRGLTYGVYASLKRTKTASYMSGYLQTKLSTQEEAKKLIQEVVDTFVQKGITKEELEAAKLFLVGSEPLRVETLSQRLGRAFNDYYMQRPLGFSKTQLKKLEAVSLKDMNNFIMAHKELSKISFSIVTKEDKKVKKGQ